MPPLGVALAPHVQGRSSAGSLAFLHPAGGGADNMWVATWSGLQMPNCAQMTPFYAWRMSKKMFQMEPSRLVGVIV